MKNGNNKSSNDLQDKQIALDFAARPAPEVSAPELIASKIRKNVVQFTTRADFQRQKNEDSYGAFLEKLLARAKLANWD